MSDNIYSLQLMYGTQLQAELFFKTYTDAFTVREVLFEALKGDQLHKPITLHDEFEQEITFLPEDLKYCNIINHNEYDKIATIMQNRMQDRQLRARDAMGITQADETLSQFANNN